MCCIAQMLMNVQETRDYKPTPVRMKFNAVLFVIVAELGPIYKMMKGWPRGLCVRNMRNLQNLEADLFLLVIYVIEAASAAKNDLQILVLIL